MILSKPICVGFCDLLLQDANQKMQTAESLDNF